MATPRLKEKYTKEVVQALKTKFEYSSVMQVPKIDKICINKGMGIAVTDKKLIDVALEEITTITILMSSLILTFGAALAG